MPTVVSNRALAFGLLLLIAAASAPAMAQSQAGLLMQVQSQKGGFFPAEGGGKSQSQNAIPLLGWTYSAAIPMDQRGMATGARRYGPVSFEKPIGAASPRFLQAMLNGEPLIISVDVVGPGPQGTPVLLHRVQFGQARILSITRNSTSAGSTSASGTARANGAPQTAETVTFDFRVIDVDPGSNWHVHDEIEAR